MEPSHSFLGEMPEAAPEPYDDDRFYAPHVKRDNHTAVNASRSFLSRSFGPMRAGSQRASVIALTTSAVGTGVLALPTVVKNSGIVLGPVVILVGAIISFVSMYLLVDVGSKLAISARGIPSYSELCEMVHGRRLALFLEFCMLAYCLGTNTGYMIVIGKCVPDVLAAFDVTSGLVTERWLIIVAISAVIVFPLALKKELSALRFVGLFSILSILNVCVSIAVRTFTGSAEWSKLPLAVWDWNLPSSITIVIFAFTCQQNLLEVYHELHDPLLEGAQRTRKGGREYITVSSASETGPTGEPSQDDEEIPAEVLLSRSLNNQTRRMNKVITRSLFIELLLYSAVGSFGFATFGSDVQSNILANYDKKDKLFVVARCCVTVALAFNSPLQVHPAMKTVERVVFGGKPLSQSRHVLSTLLFVSVTAAVAVFVPNISIVFSILGSTACTAITQIIPGLLFVAVSPGRLSSPHKLACIALVCAVTLVGGASIVQTIVNAAT